MLLLGGGGGSGGEDGEEFVGRRSSLVRPALPPGTATCVPSSVAETTAIMLETSAAVRPGIRKVVLPASDAPFLEVASFG